MPSQKPTRARIRKLIEEATVDAYNRSEQVTGFMTMLENDLELPFETSVLGATVKVTGIDVTRDDALVAICARGRTKQRIGLSDLPLPSKRPRGAEWIDAYRAWLEGSW
jgi:hypothetical protein